MSSYICAVQQRWLSKKWIIYFATCTYVYYSCNVNTVFYRNLKNFPYLIKQAQMITTLRQYARVTLWKFPLERLRVSGWVCAHVILLYYSRVYVIRLPHTVWNILFGCDVGKHGNREYSLKSQNQFICLFNVYG